jgi:hypothetical protein
MYKTTTQRPGIVGQTPGRSIIGYEFEDAFGAWLSDALELPRDCVIPGWKFAREKAPDWADCAFFYLGTVKADEVDQEPTEDGGMVIDYYGCLTVTVVLYGMNARLLSMLLCDTFSVDQNAEYLHKVCGLAYVDSQVQAQLLEPVGGDYRQRADVSITFNYHYQRTWAVRPIAEAPDATIFKS